MCRVNKSRDTETRLVAAWAWQGGTEGVGGAAQATPTDGHEVQLCLKSCTTRLDVMWLMELKVHKLGMWPRWVLRWVLPPLRDFTPTPSCPDAPTRTGQQHFQRMERNVHKTALFLSAFLLLNAWELIPCVHDPPGN